MDRFIKNPSLRQNKPSPPPPGPGTLPLSSSLKIANLSWEFLRQNACLVMGEGTSRDSRSSGPLFYVPVVLLWDTCTAINDDENSILSGPSI